MSPAESKPLSMHGNSSRGKREVPRTPTGDEILVGRQGKADGRNPCAHARGKSHGCIVPEKPPNKGCAPGSAEVVEGRRPTKGNEPRQAALRTQSREGASTGLRRVREVVRRDRRAQFTALLHHVTLELLEKSFLALKRGAAPGVDGKTWKQYAEGLEEHLRDLHQRVQQGTYRAQASMRAYIPKADGRMRPLGIAALDALWVGLTRKQVNWVFGADIQGFFENLSHEWLEKFVAHRIGDPRIQRLIRKWLRAGVSENGVWSKTEVGTQQGLRRTYPDLPFERYADDAIVHCRTEAQAHAVRAAISARIQESRLELHPAKT